MKKISQKALKQVADDLGQIRAEAAILKTDEAALRKILIDNDVDVIEGDLFRANVVEANRTNIDWKTIAAKLSPSRQLVKAHTTLGTSISVRITSRVGVAA